MNSNGFRPIYLTIILVAIASLGFYFLNTKSANESEKNLTQKALAKLEKKSPKLKEILEKNQQAQMEKAQSPIPLPPGATMLTRERLYTQDEIDSMSEEQFQTMLADVSRRLPVKADIKEIPAQALHHTPAIVIEAGRNLGAIKEVIKVHPDYEKMTIPFYEKCSQNSEGTTTVRALCLTNLIFIKKKNGENINLKNYPADIVKLSQLVTDM